MMRFYNNAAKIFGILLFLCRRFVNFVVTRFLKQAEGVDYKRLPLECFFLKKVFECRRLCRRLDVNVNYPKVLIIIPERIFDITSFPNDTSLSINCFFLSLRLDSVHIFFNSSICSSVKYC